MNCTNIRPLLSAFLDGETTPQERRLVEQHLAGCDSCAAVLQQYRQIGTSIRRLPRPTPPPRLREAVLSQLGTRPHRALLFARPAASLAGLAAVAAVVVLLVLGLSTLFQRLEQPTGISVTASRPLNQPYDVPVDTSIQLEFNRPMDVASVDRALSIHPNFDHQVVWQGNTLKIVPKGTLTPDTDYVVTISGAASDQSGTPLKQPYSVAFHTKKSAETPTPQPTEPQSSSSKPTELPSPTAEPTQPATPVPPTAPPETATPEASPTPEETPISPTPEASVTPATPEPTEGSATPQSTPATPEATPPAETPVTATPEPTTPPLENYDIKPVLGFGLLYFGHSEVRNGLGPASDYEKPSLVAEESFQSGLMYWRQDTKQIYVFFNDGTWNVYADQYTGSEQIPATEEPPASFHKPENGFGFLWSTEPGLRERLGWAVAPEHSFSGVTEAFEHGEMLWSDSLVIHVLYDSGAYTDYPDAFGR
jgi:hypothetical protein